MVNKIKPNPNQRVFEGIDLTGKFVIGYDTMVQGNLACMEEDDDGISRPSLFDSEEDAIKKSFDENLCMLQAHEEDDALEEVHDGEITYEMIREMERIYKSGDAAAMKKFMDENEQCNYNDEFILPAEEFLYGRKVFFPSGVQGVPLNELTFKTLWENE